MSSKKYIGHVNICNKLEKLFAIHEPGKTFTPGIVAASISRDFVTRQQLFYNAAAKEETLENHDHFIQSY